MPFEKEVKAGSQWLDQMAPGWYQTINIEMLNLGSYNSCCLGRTFGQMTSENLCQDASFSLSHGFILDLDAPPKKILRFFKNPKYKEFEKRREGMYRLLTAAWIQEILRRRAIDRLELEAIAKVTQEQTAE